MILMDMMGYKELRLGRADLGTTWLQDVVWQTAKQIGYGSQFVDAPEGVGDDDHSPFLKAGHRFARHHSAEYLSVLAYEGRYAR